MLLESEQTYTSMNGLNVMIMKVCVPVYGPPPAGVSPVSAEPGLGGPKPEERRLAPIRSVPEKCDSSSVSMSAGA